jgi:hypothetical protein
MEAAASKILFSDGVERGCRTYVLALCLLQLL